MKYTGNTPFGLRQTDQSSSGIFSAGVERITIDANGNIGIGTTTPTQSLHVEGSIFIKNNSFIRSKDGGSTVYDLLGVLSNGHVQVGQPNRGLKFRGGGSTSDIYFELAGSTQFILKGSTGNFGIGTTSPSAKLHISDSDPRIRLTDTDGTDYYGDVYQQNGALKIESRNGTSFGNINFQGNNGTTEKEYARFNSSGFLGIGTSSPGAILDLQGPAGGQTTFLKIKSTNSSAEPMLQFDNNANTLGKIGGVNGGGLMFKTLNNVEAMRITSDGKLGIGLTAPPAKLSISGGSSAGNYDTFYISSSAYNGNLLNAAHSPHVITLLAGKAETGGNNLATSLKLVNTGTETAGGTFADIRSRAYGEIDKDITNLVNFKAEYRNWSPPNGPSTLTNHYGVQVLALGVNANGTVTNNYGIYLSPGTTATNNWGVYQAGSGVNNFFEGNLGIGTTSPTHKLQVAGTFKSVGINDSASAQAIFINGNGEVGIGVTNQTTALDVGGVFQFSTASDLLQINNDTNTGGINLSGVNSRVYFGGNRAIEGTQDGINLVLGEGYSNVQVHANSAFVVNGAQTLGGNLTVSGRTDLQRDLRLRGTDASPNLGVVRMYVDANNTLFIDAANDGNNRVEISAAGDLTVPGIITAQEFRTEFITQTVIFESGSTAFGNSADDMHLFTGKLIVEQRDAGIYSGGIADAFVISNPLMGSTGTATRMKFTGAGTSDTAAISSQMTTSGAGGFLSFATAETSNVLVTRLKIDNNGAVGIGTDPVVGSRLKLGLRNLNGDGLLLENTINSTEVAKLYQDNGDEGILSLSNSGLEHVKIRSNGASFFDGGTVGFGTQLPNSNHAVDIVGSLKVGGTGTGLGNFLTISGADNNVNLTQFDSNSGLHTFNFYTANEGLFRFLVGSSTELVRFSAQRNYFANNVGIGTLSAATTLDIVDEFPTIRLEDPVAGAYSLLSGDGGNILIAADEGNQDGGSHIAFKTDTTERARIDSAGNFGIGTSSPGAKLDVNGEIRASLFRDRDDTNYYINPSGATSAILAGKVGLGTTSPTVRLTVNENSTSFAAAITNSNSGGQGLQVTSGFGIANVLQLRNFTGFEVMRVQGDGKIGIGTTSPAEILDVAGNARAENVIAETRAYAGIGFEHWGDGGTGMNFPSNDVVNLLTAGTTRLGISSGGTVTINSNGEEGWVGNKLNVGSTSDAANGINILTSATGNAYIIFSDASDNTATEYANQIRYSHTDDFLAIQTLGTERLRIDSVGNVGIGTTTPGYKLDVVGDINTSGYYGIANNVVLEKTASYTMLRDPDGVRKIYLGGTADQTTYINGDSHRFRDGAGGTVYMAIAPSGNVGIGTTSPTAKLHIDGDIKATSAALLGGNLQILKDLNASSQYKAGLGTTGAYGTPTLLTGYDGSTILQQRDGKQFTDIFAFGNRVISVTTIGGAPKVGIGVTDPTEALEVAGSIEMHSQMPGQTVSVLQKAGYNAGDPAGALMLSLDVNDNILGAFVDYTIYDDGRDNLRSGTLQIVFNGVGEVRFTDNSTSDIGDTTIAYFQAVGQAPGAEIKFIAPDPTWHVRYHVRYL